MDVLLGLTRVQQGQIGYLVVAAFGILGVWRGVQGIRRGRIRGGGWLGCRILTPTEDKSYFWFICISQIVAGGGISAFCFWQWFNLW